jgi:hypothetical protein
MTSTGRHRAAAGGVDGNCDHTLVSIVEEGSGGEERCSRLCSLAETSRLSESIEGVGELLTSRDGRDIHQALGDEPRGKVDDRGSELPEDELGELDVEVGSVDEASLNEGGRDGDVELALVLCVDQPRRDLLGDLGRDAAEALEEEDVHLTSEGRLAAVEELADLLRASESRLVATGGTCGDDGDLVKNLANVVVGTQSDERGSRFGREELLEVANECLQ